MNIFEENEKRREHIWLCINCKCFKKDVQKFPVNYLEHCQLHGIFMGISLFPIMVIRVVEFSSGGAKLERFLPKNQHTQRKLLNFQNWCSGELSKIGHHFSNKVI